MLLLQTNVVAVVDIVAFNPHPGRRWRFACLLFGSFATTYCKLGRTSSYYAAAVDETGSIDHELHKLVLQDPHFKDSPVARSHLFLAGPTHTRHDHSDTCDMQNMTAAASPVSIF